MRLCSGICNGLLLLFCCSIVQAQKLQQAAELAAHSTSALMQCVADHPKLTAAVVYAGFTGVFIKRELGNSGLAIIRRPHLSFAPPSERYMCELLQIASQHEISNPVPGVTDDSSDSNVSTAGADTAAVADDKAADSADDADNDEQEEQGEDSSEAVSEEESDSSSDDSDDGEETDDEAETSESEAEIEAAADDFDSDADIVDDTAVPEKTRKAAVSAADSNWKKTTKKVKLGQGVSLYRRAVAGMMHFDQCDSIDGGDIIMADSSNDDDDTVGDSAFKAQEGVTVGILSKVGVFWCLSPFRVVYTHSAIPPLLKTPVRSSKTAAATTADSTEESDADADSDNSSSSSSDSSSSKVYEASYGLSTVKGAGYTGEWRFSVSYDTATDNVYFEATLYRTSQGAIISNAHEELLHTIVQSMLERSEKDRKLLQVREKQRKRFAELSAERKQQKDALKRDRVLHPEKYERKHKWTDDDFTTNSGGGRHRFGVERRADELGRMSR
jgi:uncharacterized protein (UPF0548 family)